ncbi:riboflavin synthase subunit alpha [Candidatus Uhrbacteria bacterium RIFCSPHIGHO2_12_FULL_57_11]|uniref:Riboflavin synthase n=1 Tax=Candidatus Uhrbacteria bacterium RIFCSPHIGHO2_12_FULL_57_11 TaxID=1802398 RepID=A0A1F7ULW7_9BACT|nr:MAG: riboflavin synthase subunit alpha [Candidatus Uhrbacteria bacterium RIFCSPHIGHO2_12_FULL_57_11]
MFSGIVQGRRPVVEVTPGEDSRAIVVDLGDLATGLGRGASVAIAGVCLTAVEIDGSRVRFEIMGETLERTTLGNLQAGSEVNIERSAKVGDEIGGHRVSGHVAGRARISKIERPEGNCVMTFVCESDWMQYILPKGFIALDGCSLTVVDVGNTPPPGGASWFTAHFIPETLRITTFGIKKVGDEVNLEIDPETQTIVETVRRYLESHGPQHLS